MGRTSFILLLLAAFSFSACKKGKANFTLKGVISDSTFSTGLSGAKVDIYEVMAGGSDANLLGTQTLGSDGSYSFTFPRNAAESYIIQIRKDNYFDQNIVLPFSELTIEEDNVRNYSTTAKAWAGLHFVTTNSSSVLKFTRQQGKSGCDECCLPGETVISGAIDTILYCPNDGNSIYSYSYVANGVFGVKQVTTVAFDTSYVTLTY